MGTYGIIIGHDMLSKLKIDLCFSDHVIRVNGGAREGCTAPMKDMNNAAVTTLSARFQNETFEDEW